MAGFALAFFFSANTARANVYATDIKVNGSLTSTNAASGSPVSITYRLNQAATAGVTVNILQGKTLVAAIAGGTNMGLNSVSWTPATGGTYSVSITAAATGFPFWTQISVDTNAGNYAYEPNGMAVDNNINSPYYGRVVVGCSLEGGVNPVSGAAILDGIYKMNADGTFADEGGFGFGGYTNDDAGNLSLHTNEMPSGSSFVPWKLRIGDDDRIYMLDYSSIGAIVAFDMQVTKYQVVIDDGGAEGGNLGGPNNYSGNPDLKDLYYGINNFDVTSAATTNAAVWLCDADSPNWGIWMYHMINGASDPKDTVGTQAVMTGGDLSLVSSGGCSVDTNLDIFVSQDRLNAGDPALRTMVFTNWNRGILPPEAGGAGYALGKSSGEVLWGVGTNDDADTGIMDTVINSRTHPTWVATPMDDSGGTATVTGGYNGVNGGIRVRNVADGSVVSVTNGATVQTLTNLDLGNWYTCAAWDNVGNLYAASTTADLWRVWSPPGPNTNTTVSVAQIMVPGVLINITGITASRTTPGCATVTITFTAPVNLAPSAFTLIGSSTVNGAYRAVPGAVITGGSGVYQATFSNCSTGFFRIVQGTVPGVLNITGITASRTTTGCANVTISFTASGNPAPLAFTLVGSPTLNGPYTTVAGAFITGSSGVYQATFSSCSTGFFKIEQPGL
jgi:hypothetical protein